MTTNRPNLRRYAAYALLAAIIAAGLIIAVVARPAHGATVPHRCYTPNLVLHVHRAPGGAYTGHTTHLLSLTNTSSTACSLFGYPGVSAASAPAGVQIGAAATRNPVVTPQLVIVRPGGSAWALLTVADPGLWPPAYCGPTTAGAVRVYPPGAYDPLARWWLLPTCVHDRAHVLAITVVTANPRALTG